MLTKQELKHLCEEVRTELYRKHHEILKLRKEIAKLEDKRRDYRLKLMEEEARAYER